MNDPALRLDRMDIWGPWDWVVAAAVLVVFLTFAIGAIWYMWSWHLESERHKIEMFEKSYPRPPAVTGYTDKEWEEWKRDYEGNR